ncbi:MAG: hypothetical protein H6700_11700 [Myxococcales bacterium]|nr:hypothetical protein [Myxococcales bacterium]MCB9521615.1 hypothetical protein [Myxococcales bacterium]MCB9532421.1 hypothetical protein [Myxococcales bacterium]
MPSNVPEESDLLTVSSVVAAVFGLLLAASYPLHVFLMFLWLGAALGPPKPIDGVMDLLILPWGVSCIALPILAGVVLVAGLIPAVPRTAKLAMCLALWSYNAAVISAILITLGSWPR